MPSRWENAKSFQGHKSGLNGSCQGSVWEVVGANSSSFVTLHFQNSAEKSSAATMRVTGLQGP